jgi:hypothetical protein
MQLSPGECGGARSERAGSSRCPGCDLQLAWAPPDQVWQRGNAVGIRHCRARGGLECGRVKDLHTHQRMQQGTKSDN